MQDESENQIIVGTAFDFGDREVHVTVTPQGESLWTDWTAIHDLNRSEPHYVTRAIFFDPNARKHLAQVTHENSLGVPVPEEGMRVIREEFSRNVAAHEANPDVPPVAHSVLKRILEPLFWKHVAPFLTPPITRSDQGKSER